VINPDGFNQDLETVSWAEMENFDLQRLVNRNVDLVDHVLINGELAVKDGEVVSQLGHSHNMGQFLPALVH